MTSAVHSFAGPFHTFYRVHRNDGGSQADGVGRSRKHRILLRQIHTWRGKRPEDAQDRTPSSKPGTATQQADAEPHDGSPKSSGLFSACSPLPSTLHP